MGQFSWITQDSGDAIRESYGCKDQNLTTAYLHDNKGNVWEETSYEGYGSFDGKDFFELVAEMNPEHPLIKAIPEAVLEKDKRGPGIEIVYGKEPYLSPNLTRYQDWEWVNKVPENDPSQGWGWE
jgi:hypothetical protein